MNHSTPTEYDEKQAIEIRHRGQCPHPKGHTSDSVFAAVLVTAFACYLIGIGLTLLLSRDYPKEAIERGYAIHDPKTGKWQWK